MGRLSAAPNAQATRPAAPGLRVTNLVICPVGVSPGATGGATELPPGREAQCHPPLPPGRNPHRLRCDSQRDRVEVHRYAATRWEGVVHPPFREAGRCVGTPPLTSCPLQGNPQSCATAGGVPKPRVTSGAPVPRAVLRNSGVQGLTGSRGTALGSAHAGPSLTEVPTGVRPPATRGARVLALQWRPERPPPWVAPLPRRTASNLWRPAPGRERPGRQTAIWRPPRASAVLGRPVVSRPYFVAARTDCAAGRHLA